MSQAQLDLFAWTPTPALGKACEACGALTTTGRPRGQFDWLCAICGDEPVAAHERAPAPADSEPSSEPAKVEGRIVWPVAFAELHKPLRDYQDELRGNVNAHFATSNRGLALAATGAGKTVCFSASSADVVAAGGRVLILTDQEDLVDQAIEKLHTHAGIYAAAEQADRKAHLGAKVVVATVQTIGKRLGYWPPDHFELVVCDECDRAVAPQWQKVLAHFTSAKILGVTATPKRSDRKDILKFFEKKVFEISLRALIDRRYLVPVFVQQAPITIDLRKAEGNAKGSAEFAEEDVAHAVEPIFDEVCDYLRTTARDLKTLIFLPNVETSKKFVGRAIHHGLNARHLDGESRNRKELKQGFRDWKPGTRTHSAFQYLANPILLGRGYDEPSIECICNLRPCRSVSLYQQIIGRGTRLFCPWGCGGPCEHVERKEELLVLDFLYQFKEMGPITAASLLTDSPDKIAAMEAVIAGHQGKLDLREVQARAEANMEAALVAAIEEAMKKHKGKKGEYYNAMQFAATLRIPDVMDYIPETEEESAPVPLKVQKKLSAAGFIPETVPYMGLATKLLAAVAARREAGLASCKQVFYLRKWGYTDAWNMARDRANEIMRRAFARY